jgi:hypothetical protein
LIRFDAATDINTLAYTVNMVPEGLAPSQISIAENDTICAAMLEDFLGVECGMNAAKHHKRSALSCQPAHGISAERISRVNAYTYDVALFDGGRVEGFHSFVTQDRIPKPSRSSGG